MSTTSADHPVLSQGAPDPGPLVGYGTRVVELWKIVFTAIWLAYLGIEAGRRP